MQDGRDGEVQLVVLNHRNRSSLDKRWMINLHILLGRPKRN